jgi:hypothetical protein
LPSPAWPRRYRAERSPLRSPDLSTSYEESAARPGCRCRGGFAPRFLS